MDYNEILTRLQNEYRQKEGLKPRAPNIWAWEDAAKKRGILTQRLKYLKRYLPRDSRMRQGLWPYTAIEHTKKELESVPDDYTEKPYREPSPFRLDGSVRKPVVNLFKQIRGLSNIDEAGNVLATLGRDIGKAKPGYIWSGGTTTAINALHKAGIIPYESTSKSYVIPAALAKKIDPQYKDWHKKFNELVVDIRGDPRFLKNLGATLSLKGLSNVSKSTNLQGALNELRNYFDDALHYKAASNKVEPYFDSLNQLRESNQIVANKEGEKERQKERRHLATVIANEDEDEDEPVYFYRGTPLQVAALNKVNAVLPADMSADDIITITQRVKDGEVLEDLVKDLSGIASAKTAPFDYSDDIENLIDQTSWELPANRQTLIDTGKANSICVGQRAMGYDKKIKDKKCLILIRPEDRLTAEILINTNKDGVITHAKVNQIKGPHNEKHEEDSNVRPEMDKLAAALVGRYATDQSERVEQDISDIFCKHIIKAPTHIINALSRRF